MYFVTFNLLTQTFSTKKSKPKCTEEELNYKHRLSMIFDMLTEWIQLEAVICLQEVSIKYKEELILFLIENNYAHVFENYGSSWNDYMGVCILYPNRFKVLDIKILRPASMAYFRLPKYSTKEVSWYDYFMSFFYKPNDTIFSEILRTYNRQIVITFENYTVCGLHLPCRYYNPEFMSAYMSIILHSLAKYDNLVLMGDFNSDRNSDVYRMITEGKTQYHKIDLMGVKPMVDSFVNEDIYTCKTITCMKNVESDYTGIIDYIFVSKGIEIKSKRIHPRDGRYLPNIDHPSDHTWLMVETLVK